jgi:hypothetical protein
MKNSWVLKAASALVNVVCCAVVLGLVLFTQSGFGKGDTSAFLYWTVPLSVAIAVGGKAVIALFNPAWLGVRLLSVMLTAAALAYGWVWLVYLILGPSINSFSFPIFYLWFIGNFAQLVFLSCFLPSPIKQGGIAGRFARLLLIPLVGVGGVALLFILSFAGSYLTKPEKELYLIPADFEGKFRVIYGQPCGSSLAHENDRRVLQIPADGLLLIQPDFEAGWIDNEYYLVDKAGSRQKIAELLQYQKGRENVPGVLLSGSGSFGGAMPDGSSSSESPLAIHYADFQVFTKDTASVSDQIAFRREQEFDSLMFAKVQACRKATASKR